MSRSRHARRLKRDVPSTGHVRRKPQDEEPIPDLWEVPGVRLPGNPRPTKHEPEYTYVVDATGERVCVIEAKVVKFKASSAGIDVIRKLRKVQSANRLWSGPPHHVLTNALRLLQTCTVTKYSKGEDLWYIRTGITPTQLLRQTGLDPVRTDEVLEELTRHQLLVSRGQKQCWLINMRVKGFGVQGQNYEARDLVDGWALPEEESMSKDRVRRLRSIEEHRDDLQRVLEAVRALVLSKGPTSQDGRAEVEFEGSVRQILQRDLGWSAVRIQRSLVELKLTGLSGAFPAPRGRTRRWVALDRDVTLADVKHVRENSAAKQREYQADAGKDAAELGNRYVHLMDVYRILLETVPADAKPDTKGFVEYETDYSFTDLVVQKLTSISLRTAEHLVMDLGVLGVLSTKPVLPEGHRLRRLKLGIKRFTEKDVKRIRATGQRRPSTTRVPAPRPTVKAQPPVAEVFAKLEATIKRLEARNAELEARNAELEAQQVTIPDSLRKYL